MDAHRKYGGIGIILVMKVSPSANQFGELVADPTTNELLHFTEKPETFVSDRINCGVYVFTFDIFTAIQGVSSQRKDKALNDTLREEVNRLKIEMGQVPAAYGNSFSRALPPQFPTHPTLFHHVANHQAQQQQQLHMPQSTSNDSQTLSGQLQPSFTDFNQRV